MSKKSASPYNFSMDKKSMEKLSKECNHHYEFCEFALQYYFRQEFLDRHIISMLSELYSISYKTFSELRYLSESRPFKEEKGYFLLTSEDALLVQALLKAYTYSKGAFLKQTKVSLLEN